MYFSSLIFTKLVLAFFYFRGTIFTPNCVMSNFTLLRDIYISALCISFEIPPSKHMYFLAVYSVLSANKHLPFCVLFLLPALLCHIFGIYVALCIDFGSICFFSSLTSLKNLFPLLWLILGYSGVWHLVTFIVC